MPNRLTRHWFGRGGRWWALTVACFVAMLGSFGGTAHAQNGLQNLAAVKPVTDCATLATLATLGMDGATDAPVTVQSATVVTTGAPAPYCDVKGTIAPANMFELRLPTEGWTHRYLQAGCGGLCGNVNVNPPMSATCAPVTDGTIAIAATDICSPVSRIAAAVLGPTASTF